MAFLIAKSDYVINASFIIQIEALITLFAGFMYSRVVSNFLWTLETLRFLFGMRLNPRMAATCQFSETEKEAISKMSGTIQPNIEWEGRIYGWTMHSLWLTTGTVLFDIFLGKPIKALLSPTLESWLNLLVQRMMHH
jgi:hypothetical protein